MINTWSCLATKKSLVNRSDGVVLLSHLKSDRFVGNRWSLVSNFIWHVYRLARAPEYHPSNCTLQSSAVSSVGSFPPSLPPSLSPLGWYLLPLSESVSAVVKILLSTTRLNTTSNSLLATFRKLYTTTASTNMAAKSFHDFTVNDIKHQPYDLAQLKGKVVLVVNTASECGFTNQYDGLQKLYDQYKDKGFTVLGFPCNQFGGQEPGSEDQIQNFCTTRFNVKFPLMEKVDVNGDNTHPLYQWMKSQKSQLMMERIKWNFEKFLIGKDGQVVDRFASTTTPDSIAKNVEKELSK
ncbi:hypothetical protein MP228_000404 [Amoeboaphelidium protococcarum]|nr:hypothetical protein MP228_000404 [Amoeboaphelidium protococcarum]